MEYKRESGEKNLKDFISWNNRSLIIMINAAVVLIVVIIAMAIQLVHLDSQGMPEKDIQSRAAATDSPTAEPSPTAAPKIERIRKDLDKDKPMVALTFDDGPYDKVTDRLVKALAENDSRATFFVVGNRIEKFPDSLKNAHDHGNQIATHTFGHSDLSKMNKSGIKKELGKSIRAIKKVTGHGPAMLRPPYGNVSQTMRKNIKMPMIYWSVDTEDWRSRNKKQILKRCKSIEDGDVVLMHDLYPTTADAVAALVPRLCKKGYQLVTVEELFYYKGIDAADGKVYYSGK